MFHLNPNEVPNNAGKVFEEVYPLHGGCRDGDVQTVALFVATGDRQTLYSEDSFYGWTPSHWAAYSGKLECLCKMMSVPGGCNFDIASSRFSQTPSHIASFRGRLDCLQWLLQAGGNVNRQDHLGETPLHKAARTGSMECLSLLSSVGANILMLNNNGLTASNLALLCGHTEASGYLKQMEDCHPNPNGFRNNFDKSEFMNGVFNKKDFIKQGLNGGHLPETALGNGFHANGISPRNGVHTNGHCNMVLPTMNGKVNGSPVGNGHMDMDTSDIQNPHQNGFCAVNGLGKNGLSQPKVMLGGCKRPYEDKIDEEVKRIRTIEEKRISDEANNYGELSPIVEQEHQLLQPPAASSPLRPKQLRYWLYVV